MNWRNFIEESHAKTYKLPAGWDSTDSIAEQMECNRDSVRRLLGPAIKAGSVESGVFPVFDTVTKKMIRVTAYRKTQPKPAVAVKAVAR